MWTDKRWAIKHGGKQREGVAWPLLSVLPCLGNTLYIQGTAHCTYWALHTVHTGHCTLYVHTGHCTLHILGTGTARYTLETPHCTLQRLHTVWNYFANTFNTIGYHNYDNEVTSKFWLLLLYLLCMIKCSLKKAIVHCCN